MNAPTIVPPQSIEAEQSVLGGLLLDNAGYDRIAGLLSEGDFYRADHRLIFRHIVQLVEHSQPADALTVAESLERAGSLVEVGGNSYLGSLAASTPSAANIHRYAEIVRGRSLMRQLVTAGHRIAESGYMPQGREAKELLDEAQALVLAIGEGARDKHADFLTTRVVMSDVVEFVDEQHQRHASGQSNDVTGTPTGFIDLDKKTTGMQPGQLIILAARPAMGKTALSLNITENASSETGKTGVFFSQEMRARELGLRLLASAAGVNVQRLVTGRIYDQEWPRVTDAFGKISDLNIAFNQAPGLTITELRALARRARREFGALSVIVVDYLQLMLSGGNDMNRAMQLAEITRGLKLLALELEVPVVALSQLNRELEKRPNKRPLMSDLRDSGAIEQDADVILFIYRDEVYHPESFDKGVAEVIVAKQRNGPTGTVRLTFRADQTRFMNFADTGQS